MMKMAGDCIPGILVRKLTGNLNDEESNSFVAWLESSFPHRQQHLIYEMIWNHCLLYKPEIVFSAEFKFTTNKWE